jgi:serine/threonine protein phosphatase PrpC
VLVHFRQAKVFDETRASNNMHYISFQEAVSLVQNFSDAEVASRELIKEAYTRGSSDNITCVVVRFDPHPNATSGN